MFSLPLTLANNSNYLLEFIVTASNKANMVLALNRGPLYNVTEEISSHYPYPILNFYGYEKKLAFLAPPPFFSICLNENS